MALDVLLLEVWNRNTPYRLLPSDNIGIAFLKAALDAHTDLTTGMINSERLYFHEAVEGDPLERILDYIAHYASDNPRLILGLSGTKTRLGDLKQLAARVRGCHPDITIMAGGYGPTFSPGEVLASGVSAVCIGEGDATVIELVKALRGEKHLSQVAGIAYLRDGGLVTTPPRPLVDVSTLPPPSFVYVNGRSLLAEEYAYAHRGCCYRCDFCNVHQFYAKGPGRVWRPRSAGQLHREYRIRRFLNPGLKLIGHADDNFLIQADFLEELRDRILSDPLTHDLRIVFSAGACEINRHWTTIERCLDVVSGIAFGYESRVRSFLLRQRKGPPGVDMVHENREAVRKLQEARARHAHFNYSINHILADRHSTLDELADIYPREEDFDKVQWAIRVLRNGSTVIDYRDERNKMYPLFVQAYARVVGSVCGFTHPLTLFESSIAGQHRAVLESALEGVFRQAHQIAQAVYDRHGDQQGALDDSDDDLGAAVREAIMTQRHSLHTVLATFIVALARVLFVRKPVQDLLARPWFKGFGARLRRDFSHHDSIAMPAYMKVFAALFDRLESQTEGPGEWLLPCNDKTHRQISQVYGTRIVAVIQSVAEEAASQGFSSADDGLAVEAIDEIETLIDEMVALYQAQMLV